MAFDGSGNYVLSDTIAPATNADANELQAILTDIQNALNKCVVADGQSTITGALKGADGTVSLPAYAFAADLNTGIYRKGSDNVGVACGGAEVLDVTTAGASVTGTFGFNGNFAINTNKFTVAGASGNTVIAGTTAHTGAVTFAAAVDGANGTVSLPQYTFTNDLDCGLYRIGANNLGIAVNGAKVLDIATTGLSVTGAIAASSATTPTTQRLTTAAGATYTATSASVVRQRVRMVGAGGGGGAAATNAGFASASDTSFQVNGAGTAWTAVKGGGGGTSGGSPGIGGTSGTDGSTGALIARFSGAAGGSAFVSAAGSLPGGGGGSSPFGGAAPGIAAGTGQAAKANTGSGGGGGGISGGNGGAGGGAGEYVEFWVTGMATATYTIGAGGAGGTAGTQAGGAGGSGYIIVEEFYN